MRSRFKFYLNLALFGYTIGRSYWAFQPDAIIRTPNPLPREHGRLKY